MKTYSFLQCTSMNIPVDSFPQVLFTMHLYSPLWFLLMLMIVSSFPSVRWPVLTFFKKTFREGVPEVTLHSFVTFLPSSTVTFRSCSIVGGSVRNAFKCEVNTVLLLIKMQLCLLLQPCMLTPSTKKFQNTPLNRALQNVKFTYFLTSFRPDAPM